MRKKPRRAVVSQETVAISAMAAPDQTHIVGANVDGPDVVDEPIGRMRASAETADSIRVERASVRVAISSRQMSSLQSLNRGSGNQPVVPKTLAP
jgi:hypothetical protein